MSFLRRLFGGSKDEGKSGRPADPTGIYLYVQCDRCQATVRLRADKQYDLIDSGRGYEWHKTIVDSRCFQRIPTVVYFDRQYNIVEAEIEGGHYISEEEYLEAQKPPPKEEEEGDSEIKLGE